MTFTDPDDPFGDEYDDEEIKITSFSPAGIMPQGWMPARVLPQKT